MLSTPAIIDRCVNWAVQGVVREYPHHFPWLSQEPRTFTRPRDVTPVFYGCFDWHSAVHSHWLLARCLKLFPTATWASEVRELLTEQLTTSGLSVELDFLNCPSRSSFERPYGWAWLLQLAAELHTADSVEELTWREALRPLEALIATRLRSWLPSLTGPIRTGEHSQTAFALGLMADWAETVGDRHLAQLIGETALRFYADDVDLPIRWEPSAYDFLSPALAEADLLRRCLPPGEFASWLHRALPGVPTGTLQPVTATNLADGKAAHFAGLNFSRAWMLDGMAWGLPADDDRRRPLRELASRHITAGLPVLQTDEYAVTHWVGSFVVYAITHCGLSSSAPIRIA